MRQAMTQLPFTTLCRIKCLHILVGIWAVGCIVSLCPDIAHAKSAKRVALLIGHNKGDWRLKPLRFAQQDAKKLRWILRHLGGYPSSQIHLMLSPSLRQVRQKMKLIRQRLARQNQQGIFLFYYSGHAQQSHFQLGSEKLPFREVLRFVKSLPVKVKLLLVDSCYSGRLLRAKGPKRLSTIQWAPPQTVSTKGLAILTSSGENSRSYESDKIQGSLFTSSLLAGLRGAADKDLDQQVSLSELHHYVYQQTLNRSLETLSGVQRPGHRFNLRGHGPLVMSRLQYAPAQLVVPKQVKGHLFVYRRETLVQDVRKGKASSIRMGLNAGTYLLKIRYNGWVGRYRFVVARRTKHTLNVGSIRWKQLSIREQFKGGEHTNAPFGLGASLQYRPLTQLAINGVGVSLGLDSGRWLRAQIGYVFGAQNPLNVEFQSHSFFLQLSVGYGLDFRNLGLWFGAALEPLFVVRNSRTDSLWNMGFSLLAIGQLDYYLRPGLAMRITIAGGSNSILFRDNVFLTAATLRTGIGLVWKP